MSFYWSYLLEMMAQLDLTFNILYKLYPAFQHICNKYLTKCQEKEWREGFTQLLSETGAAQVGRLELFLLHKKSKLQMTPNQMFIYKWGLPMSNHDDIYYISSTIASHHSCSWLAIAPHQILRNDQPRLLQWQACPYMLRSDYRKLS